MTPNAGLLLPATLAERRGIEQAADALIDLGERAGAHRPGRKLLTMIHSMIGGADCIDYGTGRVPARARASGRVDAASSGVPCGSGRSYVRNAVPSVVDVRVQVKFFGDQSRFRRYLSMVNTTG